MQEIRDISLINTRSMIEAINRSDKKFWELEKGKPGWEGEYAPTSCIMHLDAQIQSAISTPEHKPLKSRMLQGSFDTLSKSISETTELEQLCGIFYLAASHALFANYKGDKDGVLCAQELQRKALRTIASLFLHERPRPQEAASGN